MERAFLIGLIAAVAGCNSGPRMEVRQFWFPAASPYGLGSQYAWIEAEDVEGYNPDYQNLLRENIDRVMRDKGYVSTDTDNADFRVRTQFGRENLLADTGNQTFDQAAVAIDFLDNDSNAKLWRGWLLTRIEYDLAPATRRERLKTGVEKILKELPPPRDLRRKE